MPDDISYFDVAAFLAEIEPDYPNTSKMPNRPTETKAAIVAYSIAVTPLSSAKN